MELTGNEVVSAIAMNITSAINSGFISNVTEISKLYKDTPIQGMVTPCAFIHSVSTDSTQEIGDYSIWNYIVDIRCHPKEAQTGVQSWARQLAVKLLECIERIYISNQRVRATNVEWRIEENVLHVICNYRFRVLRTKTPGTPMESLSYSEHTKGR